MFLLLCVYWPGTSQKNRLYTAESCHAIAGHQKASDHHAPSCLDKCSVCRTYTA